MPKRLPKGWVEGSIQELFDLTDEEAEVIEIRARLAAQVRERRRKQTVTQQQLAARLGTSQSRVSKAERTDASLETLIRSLLVLGASRKEIARVIASC